MRVQREERAAIFAGAGIFDALPKDATLTAEDGRSAPFFEFFYQAETVKSGMHHPDGALWIRTPARRHRVVEDRVSLRAVAPTLLSMFSVEPPMFMRAEPLHYAMETVATCTE